MPVKVMSTWSRNLSIFYVIGAHLENTLAGKRHAILKHLTNLSKAWQDDLFGKFLRIFLRESTS